MRIGRFVGMLILCSTMTAGAVNATLISSKEVAVLMKHYTEIGKIIGEHGSSNDWQFIGPLNESAEKYLMDDLDTAKDLLSEAVAFLQEMDKYLRKPGTQTNVRRWYGPGTKTTELFKIYGKEWVLKWQGPGLPIKISIYKVDGSEMILMDSFDNIEGVERIRQGGVFCLKIVGPYKWTVHVDVEN